MTLGYERSLGNSMSNLGQTDGFWCISLGGTYLSVKTNIFGGVRYIGVGEDNRATFTDSSAWSVGFKITCALD